MKKKIFSLENLLCLFVILCPVLDMSSFIFRNIFNTSFSPSTILRPVIPIIVFAVIFFKEKGKKKKILVCSIYAIYSIIHIVIFNKVKSESSYGNVRNELQYIINYSFMIIDLFIFLSVFKDISKNKLKKSVFIAITIYIISIFISIVTNTSSNTYPEGIGYKGWYESGNSLCTLLLIGLCIIFPTFLLNKNTTKTIIDKIPKTLLIILLVGIYLVALVGTRTGLFGFALITGIFILSEFFTKIIGKIKISRKYVAIISSVIILSVSLVLTVGSETLIRRKELKENQQNNIDQETGEIRNVTGDILVLKKKIENKEIDTEYMPIQVQNAITRLCQYATKTNLSNVDLRKQQLIYNVFLLLEQRNPILILFGNGYKAQFRELVMEMEVPAFLCNFGLIGFTLYFVPFATIFIYAVYIAIKNIKYVNTEYIMYLAGSGLAIALSTLSGYVFFNFSSMTFTIVINVLLLEKIKQLRNDVSEV